MRWEKVIFLHKSNITFGNPYICIISLIFSLHQKQIKTAVIFFILHFFKENCFTFSMNLGKFSIEGLIPWKMITVTHCHDKSSYLFSLLIFISENLHTVLPGFPPSYCLVFFSMTSWHWVQRTCLPILNDYSLTREHNILFHWVCLHHRPLLWSDWVDNNICTMSLCHIMKSV